MNDTGKVLGIAGLAMAMVCGVQGQETQASRTSLHTLRGKLAVSEMKAELLRQNRAEGNLLTEEEIDAFWETMLSRKADHRRTPSLQVGFYDSPGPATSRDIPLGNRTPLILVHGSSSDIISDGSFHRPLNDLERWIDYLGAFNADPQFPNHYKVYRFVYDSRLPIRQNGANLARVIDTISTYPGWENEDLDDRPFVILAHSMGGLVSRAAMSHHFTEGNDAGDKVGDHVIQAVTLGTPNHGVPTAVPSWVWDSVLRGAISEVEFTAIYVFELGFTPIDAQFDLAWDNFDDGVPLGNISSSPYVYSAAMVAVGGERDQHVQGLTDPEIGELNEVDIFQDRVTAYATRFPPEGDVDSLFELSFLATIGTLNEHHLLGFSGSRLAQIIAGDYGEGDLRPYGVNDGLVPVSSATLVGHALGETIVIDGGDHQTLLDDAATVNRVKAKLLEFAAR